MKTDVQSNIKTEITSDQVYSQTLEATVHNLCTLAVDNWIGLGRVINNYCHNVPKNSPAKIDRYKELASSRQCPFKDSQLRNYVSCYRLWQQLGGYESAPTLSMAHYLLVMPARVPEFKKRHYLIYAKEHNLNASRFRDYLEEELLLTPDLTKYLGKHLENIRDRISNINCRDKIKNDPDLKNTLRSIIDQIFAHKLLRIEEFSQNQMHSNQINPI